MRAEAPLQRNEKRKKKMGNDSAGFVLAGCERPAHGIRQATSRAPDAEALYGRLLAAGGTRAQPIRQAPFDKLRAGRAGKQRRNKAVSSHRTP